MTQKEIETLIDFEQQIQWRWSCGDASAYMDALAEDVTYVDPLANQFLHGRQAVYEHFKRIKVLIIQTAKSGFSKQRTI